MFRGLKKAYSAGWRAGMAGAHFADHPFTLRRHFLHAHLWGNGWETGIKRQIQRWLDSKRVYPTKPGPYWYFAVTQELKEAIESLTIKDKI